MQHTSLVDDEEYCFQILPIIDQSISEHCQAGTTEFDPVVNLRDLYQDVQLKANRELMEVYFIKSPLCTLLDLFRVAGYIEVQMVGIASSAYFLNKMKQKSNN